MEYLEFSFLGYVEDRFDCSGMCTPSLFYFARNITAAAVPENTCLQEMRSFLKDEAGGFGAICLLMGLVSFCCFLMHFFLYGKDETIGSAA